MGCLMVDGRSLVVGRSFHSVISQRRRDITGSLHNDVVATSCHNVIIVET